MSGINFVLYNFRAKKGKQHPAKEWEAQEI